MIALSSHDQRTNKTQFVLITHSHIDHCACLPLTMIGDAESNHVFKLFGPAPAADYFARYIASMFALNAVQTFDGDVAQWYTYTGVARGQFFELVKPKRFHLQVEVFECDHPIPTVSYGVAERKAKLKDEYADKQGKEIAALRKEGVEVTHLVTMRRFAYVCDTSIAVFDLNPTVLLYPVVFVECTFILDDELDNAVKTKHIHWRSLRPIGELESGGEGGRRGCSQTAAPVEKNPNVFFCLFHFSQRYRDAEITAFFQREVDAGLKNIHWW